MNNSTDRQASPDLPDYRADLERETIRIAGIMQRSFSFKLGKRFRLEFTPSIDSGIGPHLDADIYADIFVQGRLQENQPLGRATMLSDLLRPSQEGRRGYVRTLIESKGQITFLSEGREYQVVLKRELTTTDSAALARMFPELDFNITASQP